MASLQYKFNTSTDLVQSNVYIPIVISTTVSLCAKHTLKCGLRQKWQLFLLLLNPLLPVFPAMCSAVRHYGVPISK